MTGRLFESKYGYFSQDGREYVITTPITPRPWCNVISNGDYGMMVSQTGGGYSWRGNAGQNRITRASQDLVKDNWGKYIYIRDLDSGKVWSASWKPVESDYEYYRVRNGIGYTVFEQKVEGIASRLTMFIAPDAPVEILKLEVANESERTRRLDITSYFEWILGWAPDDHREFHKLFIDTRFDTQVNAIKAIKHLWSFPDEKGRHNNVSWPYTAFHASSLPVASYDTYKESFVGMYGNEKNPAAMEQDSLACNTGRFGDAAAALRTEIIPLAPGENKVVVFTIGAVENDSEDLDEIIRKYTSETAAESAFIDLEKFWSRFIDGEKVETPDAALNIMTNIWMKYQAISCRLWGKSAYYQVSAGYGYRDQLQDCQIFLAGNPEFTKKQILLHAAQQYLEGDVLHWWFTIRGGGPRTKCSDDLLWLPFILDAYLKETKDFSILDERTPYLNGGDDDLYNHCKRAIEKVFTRFSPRGIPLMGDHDWNDGLSAIGTDWKGESFWVAEFLHVVLNGFTGIAEYRGDIKFVQLCRDTMIALEEALEKFGWDGKWYLQATTDDGEKVGSLENEEGRIFLNPQLWAVISGMADTDRAKVCMDSVTDYLLKDYGALLLYPAYTKVRADIGYITRYAPGLRENGGVYTHAATWAVWAYALMGDSERAYQAYKRICPPNRSEDPDSYWAEPYVTPGNSDGPISPYYGRGGWTWYTGSAQWLHRVATNWLLGIRAELDGLRVDPCIPSEWDGFRMERSFRGTKYEIEVQNPLHVSRGIKMLTIDGECYAGNLIPDLTDGKTHKVVALMG
jgi:cellobiose phosphorylase